MATTVQLTFYIYLTDAARVRDLQAANPNGVIRGPLPAATEFSAPWQTADQPVTYPCTRTAWAPTAASAKFKYDRAVFTVSGGGFFGWLGIGNTRYVWVGRFIYAPTSPPTDGAAPGVNTEIEPPPQRKWIHGFEMPSPGGSQESGEGAVGVGRPGRAYSRTPDGYGLGIRSAAATITQQATQFVGSTNTRTWERLYIRLVRAPAAGTPFWRMSGTGGTGSEGIKLYMTPSGQIAVYSVDNSAVETFQGSTPAVTLGQWTKLDLVYQFQLIPNAAPVDTGITIQVWVNGALSVSIGSDTGPVVRAGFVGSLTHGTTQVGNTGATSLEMDVDDWIGAEWPHRFSATSYFGSGTTNAGSYAGFGGKIWRCIQTHTGNHPPPDNAYWVQSLGPTDFFSGSHVLLAKPQSFGAAHQASAWGTPDIRALIRIPHDGIAEVGEASSTTANAVLEVNTDATKYGLGAAAIVAGVHGAATGAGTLLGVGIAGAAPSMLTPSPVMDGSRKWNAIMYRPAATPIAPIHPLTIRFQKANNATATPVQALNAAIEYIGTFDACDVIVDPATPSAVAPAMPRIPGIHNAPYPFSPWASLTSTPPLAGVKVKTGTYVGNAAGLDALLNSVPAHLWWVRPVTGPSGGVHWFSSMLGSGHIGLEGSPNPEALSISAQNTAYVSPGTDSDGEQQFFQRLAGSNTQANANTVVYQYLWFSDPGARFLLNGAFCHGANALDNGAAHAMVDAGFVSEFLLAVAEFLTNPRTGASYFYGKGGGHAADAGSVLDGAQTASLINIATAGSIKSFSALHTAGLAQIAYAAFRSVQPGDPNPSQVVFQIRTYTGDGNATRDLVLTPSSGKRPLWALVIPTDSAAVFRDPQHSGGNSSRVATAAPIANAIKGGGLDFITVGVTLNANGINYSVLVIPGLTTGGNDGWSIDAEIILKDPSMPTGTQFDPPPLSEPAIDIVENPPATPATPPPDQPDLSTVACAAATTKVVNQALGHIGVTKTIGDLATENSQEAATSRLHIKDDVEEVLRRYPWPFATRYATLVLVAGTVDTPVNPDWQYAYRVPADAITARRLTNQLGAKRKFDPDPIAFKRGTDDTGGLLYTDATSTTDIPLVLEYTARLVCPAVQGDALFRQALAWKHASALALGLSRDTTKAAYCEQKFRDVLITAKVETANEQERQKPDDDAPDWIRGR